MSRESRAIIRTIRRDARREARTALREKGSDTYPMLLSMGAIGVAAAASALIFYAVHAAHATWPNLLIWPQPGGGPFSSLDWWIGIASAPLWVAMFAVQSKVYAWGERRMRRIWIGAYRTALRRRLNSYSVAIEHARSGEAPA